MYNVYDISVNYSYANAKTFITVITINKTMQSMNKHDRNTTGSDGVSERSKGSFSVSLSVCMCMFVCVCLFVSLSVCLPACMYIRPKENLNNHGKQQGNKQTLEIQDWL